MSTASWQMFLISFFASSIQESLRISQDILPCNILTVYTMWILNGRYETNVRKMLFSIAMTSHSSHLLVKSETIIAMCGCAFQCFFFCLVWWFFYFIFQYLYVLNKQRKSTSEIMSTEIRANCNRRLSAYIDLSSICVCTRTSIHYKTRNVCIVLKCEICK